MICDSVKRLNTIYTDKKIASFTSSVQSNFVDDEIYEECIKESSALTMSNTNNFMRKEEDIPFVNKLEKDVFNALYKISPAIYSKENVTESLKLENDIVTEIASNEAFQSFRESTSGDIFSTIYATKLFKKQAKEIYKSWKEDDKINQEYLKKMNDAIDVQEKFNKINNQIEEMKQEEPDYIDKQELDDLQNTADQLEDMAQAANMLVGAASSNGPSSVTASDLKGELQKAIKDAAQEAEEVNDMMKTLGFGSNNGFNNAEAQRVSVEDKLKIANSLANSYKIKNIVKVLGRMQENFKDVGKKPYHYGQVVSEIGYGKRLSKVISSEKALLNNDTTKVKFVDKYANKKLLEYKTEGLSEHKGPIVVCIDTSGSMGGERDTWAKAFGMVFVNLALKDRRNCRIILFDDSVDSIFDFVDNKNNASKIIDFLSAFSGGCTDFTPPLKAAMKSVEDSRFKKSDIVFITDGDSDHLSSSFLKKINTLKKDKDLKIQGVLIKYDHRAVLETFSDDILQIDDLKDDEGLKKIVNEVID